MKGKINEDGALERERAGKFKIQKCRQSPVNPGNTDHHPMCADDCPHFDEPVFHTGEKPCWTLNICGFTCLTFSEFEDEREEVCKCVWEARDMKENGYPLEKQVCTKEQAVQIAEIFKKAGIEPPGSLWVWIKYSCSRVPILELMDIDRDWADGVEYYHSAYTGDELGVLLPVHPTIKGRDAYLNGMKLYSEWLFEYLNSNNDKPLTQRSNKAIFLAALAIDGLTNDWIKPEDFKYE